MSSNLYYPKQSIQEPYYLNIKDQSLPCIKVIIQNEDYNICNNTKLWCSEKRGKWGLGLINSEQDKTKAERIGLLGEMAFSKISNYPINIGYFKGGKDIDFITLTGCKIDIKTASKKPKYNAGLVRCLTANNKKVDLKSDLYIFGYVEKDFIKEKIAHVILIGGEYTINIRKNKIKKAKFGNHYNYEIEYVNLIPIEQLLLLINLEI